ncbi:hypothetical protein QE152_g9198 [Popillia japonica]|uniref:Uncharacterized protein n=1 Tax=Popillia japonica TaxID=7064 RepID=A0AAW1LZA3_POPJA
MAICSCSSKSTRPNIRREEPCPSTSSTSSTNVKLDSVGETSTKLISRPSTSAMAETEVQSCNIKETPTKLIHEISPIPRVLSVTTKRKLHAVELTSPKNIGVLKNKRKPLQRQVKKRIELTSPKNIGVLKNKRKPLQRQVKKRIVLKNKRKPLQRQVKKRIPLRDPSPECQEDFLYDDDDDDAYCIFCTEPFKESKRGERWVQCTK